MSQGNPFQLKSPSRKLGLEVLCCDSCGAAVPLGDGDQTTCPYCNKVKDIPQAYRALRDVEREGAAKRLQAQLLFTKLGRPPGFILRMWGGVSLGLGYLFLVPFVFVFAGIVISKGTDAISNIIHATLADVLTNAQFFTLIGAGMFVTLGLPIVFGVYGRRRTSARQRLQAALAAMPPSRKGAPAKCRKCAAPLEVGANSLGQTCYYCGTDNLVQMPEPWIGKVRKNTTSLGMTIEEAAKQDALRRSRERRSLRSQLLWLLLIFPPLFGFGKLLDSDKEKMPPSWQQALQGDRKFIYASKSSLGKYSQAAHPPIPIALAPVNILFDKEECTSVGCVQSHFVAMRYRETLTISSGELPPSVEALVVVYNTQTNSFFGDWSEIGERGILFADKAIQFQAPRSAWYRLDIICPKCEPNAKAPFTLRAQINAAGT
jgi:hypothetical protein